MACDGTTAGPGGRPTEIVDELEIEVGLGGRVLVVSDLLLGPSATTASASATTDLARAIEAWSGPGALIVAGNLFELLVADSPDASPDPRAALDAHPRLTTALRAFGAGEGRRLICLPGSRDARLAWDEAAARNVAGELGAELALVVEVALETGAGRRRVRVEPGHRLDPRHALADPRNPACTPVGHHLLTDMLPALGGARSSWLRGVDRLPEPSSFPRFLASRLAYRRLARHAWWLLVPFAVAILLKVPLSYLWAAPAQHLSHLGAWPRRLGLVGLTTVLDLMLVVLGVAWVSRRTWAAMGGVALGSSGDDPNDGGRAEATTLVGGGHAGLVTGHTRQPELTLLGRGFYANTGAVAEVIDECPARVGLPPVFLPRRQLSWIELEAGAELHARLLQARLDLQGATVVERLAARRCHIGDSHPAVVATFPHGPPYPQPADPASRQRRVRRLAAVAIALAGVVNLASVVTPPFRSHLDFVFDVVPLSVAQAASALVALAGLALLALARGIRRGQLQAWTVALGLLVGTGVLHLLQGGGVEEALIALAVAWFLMVNRSCFRGAVDRPSRRTGGLAVLAGAVAVTVVTAVSMEIALALDSDTRPLGFVRALEAVAGRMVGLRTVSLPHRLDEFLAPTLFAVGLGLALVALILAFRPVVDRRLAGADAQHRARDIVRRHGRGTLDYFALRHDKVHFFEGDSVVASAVYGGVCLVSPDPIGPEAERDRLWSSFRAYADAHGWTLAVLGAGEDWLPTYRSSGMHDLYLGDEGVVDITRFSLQGGRNKGLRQAVNRIARYGYSISFHDPAHLDRALADGLREVMTRSRRGDVERGFSMTLGRLFDPRDEDLLLAVATAADGTPVAFCQYVPAPGINGYSLDLMRRDDGDHPNGLLDFVIVETIEHLRQLGLHGLGLNFATMRSVLAGESGDGLHRRVERWMLRRMSSSMQIESLWRFNAKYDPDWQPRYAVYESPEQAPAVAVAIARAESFWELPLIGRFLVPGEPRTGTQNGEGTAEPAEQVASSARR
ncbi:MAG TPA: phosphatidylglycerol lysyltransferase domain-containing protein [Acidimicrobiales bacterium]